MAPGRGRDLLLFIALTIAGTQLGGALGHPGLGLAGALFVFVALAYARLLRLQRWLYGNPPASEPPVHGGTLGEVADRMNSLRNGLRRELEQSGQTVARLREAYAVLRDGIVMLGPENVIEWSNAAAGELLGLRYPQDAGQPVVNLVRDPDFAHYLGAGDFERCFELEEANGRALELQATAMGERRKLLFVRDVTALKRLETMRRDFVANISHELRTPLTVIAGYVGTLAELMPQESPVVARALAQMQQQAVRMEHLLRDLLLLSRIEASEGDTGGDEQVAVCAMLESIRENALAACNGERTIELGCDARLRLRGPRLQIESILSNIVFNAVRYTAPGGTIAVSFGVEDGRGVFRVVDDGVGIDPVHIPRLTERFYRVDKSRSVDSGGTGLGLAIVKHALKRLDGELRIDSRPGAGSTFACLFPQARIEGVETPRVS